MKEKQRLFKVFQEYIYECIYIYGKDSITLFKLDDRGTLDKRFNLLRESRKALKDKKEKEVLDKYINSFPDNLTMNQVNLLSELTLKSENFYSLGLSKEQSEELKKLKILDWVIFLDTNVLYSILELREHPENEACAKVIQIVNENPELFNIKFMYLQKTHEELKKARELLNDKVPKTIFTESQINAMLQSGKIDNLNSIHLRKMLKHGSDTPHPTELIQRHITILKQKGIEINKKDLSGIDPSSEQFTQCISDYKKIESIINEAKLEKGLNTKAPKEIDRVEHDVFLREAVRRLRVNKPTSLSQCKYFGLTLDTDLIKYDNYKNNQESKTSDYLMPTFFRPAFLLSKLLRLIPVEVDDYKRAFIKSISSPSITEFDKSKSKITIKTVERFNAMGIEDKTLILDCLMDDIFLVNVKAKDKEGDDNAINTLIESKIQKRINEIEERANALSIELEDIKASDNEKATALEQNKSNLKQLENKLGFTQDDLRIYKTEFEKLKNRKQSIPTHIQLDISSQIQNEESKLKNNQNDNIINWDVLLIKSKQLIKKLHGTINNSLSIVNICFVVFYVIIGITDLSNSQYYFLVAGLDIIIEGAFRISKKLRDHKLRRTFLKAIVFALFTLVLLLNKDEIYQSIVKIYSLLSTST